MTLTGRLAKLPREGKRFSKVCPRLDAEAEALQLIRNLWMRAPWRVTRTRCFVKTLFDLADIESYDPKGRAQVENGIPVLYAKYAEDDGHLNDAGRLRVARAWWWLLACLEGWDGRRK